MKHMPLSLLYVISLAGIAANIYLLRLVTAPRRQTGQTTTDAGKVCSRPE